MASDVTRLYRIKYVILDESSAVLAKIRGGLVGLNLEAETAIQQGALVGRALAAIAKEVPGLNRVDIAMRRLGQSAVETGKGFTGMGTDIAKTSEALRTTRAFLAAIKSGFVEVDEAMIRMTSGAKTLKALRENIVAAQRAAFGLKMNLEEGNAALAGLVASGQGLNQTAGAMNGVGTAAEGTEKRTRSALASTSLFIAKMAALNLATDAVSAFGGAMQEASEFAKTSADEVIRIRDGLRELANLQGKSGVDDATLKGSIQLRQATGMSDAEANEFQKQFMGTLPLAEDKGNIDRATAEATRDEVGRTAVRVGLAPKTAGDLSAGIAMFGPIATAKQGVGQVQQIIDALNAGRGDVTPLMREVMKGAAGTVGSTQAFRSLAERSAAVGVATGIVGSPGQVSTAIGAAIRGLGGFGQKQGDTLRAYGIESGQDLITQLEKIAPLIENAEKAGKNPTDALRDAGFGNEQDRRAIVGLVRQRQILRQRTDAVRETGGSTAKADAAGERSIRMNREFYQNDRAAANRQAEANLQAGKVQRGLEMEPWAIARKNAEGQLLAEKKLDTPAVLMEQKLRDILTVAPFTGDYAKDHDIDQRALDNLHKEADRVGVKIPRRRWSVTPGQTAQEELHQYGPEILRRGGNPYGQAVDIRTEAEKSNRDGREPATDPSKPDPEITGLLSRIAVAVEKKAEPPRPSRQEPMPEMPEVWAERR